MIHILKYKYEGKGCLVAKISVSVRNWGNFIIQPIRVYEKEGHRWINFPSVPYENKEGLTKYYPYNDFVDPKTKNAFQEKVLEAVKQYEKDHPMDSSNKDNLGSELYTALD